uniref:Uncharacterized protein n=1 Tax=Arundo donax TaxID=35708 RepID=A0A0A9CDR6_ARUDO
MGNIVLQNL